MSTISTLKQAEEMLAEGLADYEADTGQAGDEVWFDFVVATAHLIIEEGNEVLAREFCRTQIGSIPGDLEPYLGRKDWVQ
jgi:hypothetical protein